MPPAAAVFTLSARSIIRRSSGMSVAPGCSAVTPTGPGAAGEGGAHRLQRWGVAMVQHGVQRERAVVQCVVLQQDLRLYQRGQWRALARLRVGPQGGATAGEHGSRLHQQVVHALRQAQHAGTWGQGVDIALARGAVQGAGGSALGLPGKALAGAGQGCIALQLGPLLQGGQRR